jgi:hypothetical protein
VLECISDEEDIARMVETAANRDSGAATRANLKAGKQIHLAEPAYGSRRGANLLKLGRVERT